MYARCALFFLFIIFQNYSIYAASGQVFKVIDGDSLLLRDRGRMLEVRLYGIDSPEWDQPGAKFSRSYLRKYVVGKTLKYNILAHDRYGRLIVVLGDGKNSANYQLLKRGYAWYSGYYCRENFCASWQSAFEKARRKRLGIWRSGDAIAPWVWRKKK